MTTQNTSKVHSKLTLNIFIIIYNICRLIEGNKVLKKGNNNNENKVTK